MPIPPKLEALRAQCCWIYRRTHCRGELANLKGRLRSRILAADKHCLRHYRRSRRIPLGPMPKLKTILISPSISAPASMASSLKKRSTESCRKTKRPLRACNNAGCHSWRLSGFVGRGRSYGNSGCHYPAVVVPLLGGSQAVNGGWSKHCFCEALAHRLVSCEGRDAG